LTTYTGDVNISVVDGGGAVVSTPSQQVQAVIGTAGSGTVGQVISTRSLTTLASIFANGPLMQAAGETLQSSLNGQGAGAVVLAVRATTATPGAINGASVSVPGVSATNTSSPIQITTGSAHGLSTGDVVTIAGVTGQTGANGTFVITVLSATTFTLNNSTSVSAWISGGTIAFTGTVQTTSASAAGTSVMTFTGTPTDSLYPVVKCVIAGTIAATGIGLSFSLDGGRNFGPTIALGTATSYALKDVGGFDTGLTVNLSAGTLKVGDQAVCSTVEPLTSDAGRAAALLALQTYAASAGSGWGSIHVVGPAAGSNATALESGGSTNLDGLATAKLFTRAIMSARDASPPAAWGGTGETEAAWMAAVLADFAAISTKRISCAAGYYNQPSAFSTQFASTPSYRRSLAWAYAAREVAIPTQRHAGKVADGALSQISVDPTTDPGDGFIYHNEFLTPGFDNLLPGGVGRFTSARTHNGRTGFYISNPLSLSAFGSDFYLLPLGLVMDVACTLTNGALLQFVNADLQTANNGTLLTKDATTVYNAVYGALQSGMVGVSMISNFSVLVDQTTNLQVTKTLVVTITILGRAYVFQVNVNIGFANQLAA
jgi:hypothetical protein